MAPLDKHDDGRVKRIKATPVGKDWPDSVPVDKSLNGITWGDVVDSVNDLADRVDKLEAKKSEPK